MQISFLDLLAREIVLTACLPLAFFSRLVQTYKCFDCWVWYRDVTFVDDSRKSVMVTLWRQQAEEWGAKLEAQSNPVVVMTKMRVGDYNGVSVSSTYSSHILVNPTAYPEAAALQQWWDSEGCNQTFSPAGAALDTATLETKMTSGEACAIRHESN